MKLLFAVVLTLFAVYAQKYDAKNPPRFQDFPVKETWSPPPAPLKLTTGSERMFKTQLTNAAKLPPNFAGHYEIGYWGCGSICSAAAVIDLKTGDVYQPPLAVSNATAWDRWIMCPGRFENAEDDFHVDSRLMIVRCGLNYSERLQKNIPDTWYFVWEQNHFRELLFVSGKSDSSPKSTKSNPH